MQTAKCYVCGREIDSFRSSYINVQIEKKNGLGLLKSEMSFVACFEHAEECFKRVAEHVDEFRKATASKH